MHELFKRVCGFTVMLLHEISGEYLPENIVFFIFFYRDRFPGFFSTPPGTVLVFCLCVFIKFYRAFQFTGFNGKPMVPHSVIRFIWRHPVVNSERIPDNNFMYHFTLCKRNSCFYNLDGLLYTGCYIRYKTAISTPEMRLKNKFFFFCIQGGR